MVFTTTSFDCCDGDGEYCVFGAPLSSTVMDPSVPNAARMWNFLLSLGSVAVEPQPQRSQLELFGTPSVSKV